MQRIKSHTGLYGAPLVPFTADGEVDGQRYLAHCHALIERGCDGLMPLGSTGESHSLTLAERFTLMDLLAGSGIGVERMLVGASALAYPDALSLVRRAVEIGFGGVCVQPPFYYKPLDDDALFGFYAKIIEDIGGAGLRLYVYDWEPNIHVHHSLAFFERLFSAYPDNAVGMKDSSGNAEMLEARCRAFPDREVWVGTDGMTLTGLRAGAVGTMSSISNIVPEWSAQLHADFATGAGDKLQARINGVRTELAAFPLLPALKTVLGWHMDDEAWRAVRSPLRVLTGEERNDLRRRLEALGVLASSRAAE